MGHNYTLPTLKLLFATARTCAYPGCTTALIFNDEDRGVWEIAVQIAHIRSPKRDGPRHDPDFPSERLNSPENLLLLCGVHHHPVDRNGSQYTTEKLLEWKENQVIEGGGYLVQDDDLENLAAWRDRIARDGVGDGRRRPRRYGKPISQWDPVSLGVHRAIGSGSLPAYVRRHHDDLLDAVLDPAVAASRLVVVCGGSSTGKSRAVYEAVMSRLPRWGVDHPRTPVALADRLQAGIPRRTVMWLGELRYYADADGGSAVLARLAELLAENGYIVAVTTLWPEHWRAYTTNHYGEPGVPDHGAGTRALLGPLPDLTELGAAEVDPGHGGVIRVPKRFTKDDLELARQKHDLVLDEAIDAAADADGEVIQYLAGVPDLLRQYCEEGGDGYGQALISVAMDAARLGRANPYSSRFLQEAVVGYLTDRQRTNDLLEWWSNAIEYATQELKGAICALEPVPPEQHTGVVGYKLADYLDQHGRRSRQACVGPASLWDALAAHTASPGDLHALGSQAYNRGLYRHAALLWKQAIVAGNSSAASNLINVLDGLDHHNVAHAARWTSEPVALYHENVYLAATWIANRVALEDPSAVAGLLESLRMAGACQAVTTVLVRGPADHVVLGDLRGVAMLLRALHEAGAGGAVTALANRAVRLVSLERPGGVAELLDALNLTGAGEEEITRLARRTVDQVVFDDPWEAARLLKALHAVGAGQAVAMLSDRVARDVCIDSQRPVADLLRALHEAGAGEAVTALASRLAAQVALDHRWGAALLDELRFARRGVQIIVPASARLPGDHVALDDAYGVRTLLNALRTAEEQEVAAAKALRETGPLNDPSEVAWLLRALRSAEADEAITALLARRPADHVALDDPHGVALLMGELQWAGAGKAVTSLLARRPADHVVLHDPGRVAFLLNQLRGVGAEGGEQVTALLARHPATSAALDAPDAVAALLRALRTADEKEAVTALLARHPADHVALDYPRGVYHLREELHKAGADEAATRLHSRAEDAGLFVYMTQGNPNWDRRFTFGREPDGNPSLPWGWEDLIQQSPAFVDLAPDS